MNSEVENLAIQTFSLVPELYQKVFQESGNDFPDELVSAIKAEPEKAIEILNSDKKLKSAVINIFTSYKDQIIPAAQKAAQRPATMKNGGLLNILPISFLNKIGSYKKGGSLEKENKIHKKFDKKLEKAGKKSSKEMEDLNAQKKRQLKRIKS